MVTQHRRGAEPCATGDLVDRQVGALQQLLGTRDALTREPGRGRRPRLGTEPARERALRHERPRRERGHGVLVVEVLDHPLQQRRERVRVARQRRVDVLRLSPVAVRGHHHAPRDRRRGGRTELAAHQVEAGVDPRGGACTRQDAVVVDVQHRRVDPRLREPACQRLRVHPVRRAGSAVEQPRLAQCEHAAADAQDPRAARVRGAQRLEHGFRHGLRVHPVGRDDDEVRVERRAEVVLDVQPERAALRRERAGLLGAHPEVEHRAAGVRAVDAEDLAGHPELEGGDVRQQDHGDGAQHAGHAAVSVAGNQRMSAVPPLCGAICAVADFLP